MCFGRKANADPTAPQTTTVIDSPAHHDAPRPDATSSPPAVANGTRTLSEKDQAKMAEGFKKMAAANSAAAPIRCSDTPSTTSPPSSHENEDLLPASRTRELSSVSTTLSGTTMGSAHPPPPSSTQTTLSGVPTKPVGAETLSPRAHYRYRKHLASLSQGEKDAIKMDEYFRRAAENESLPGKRYPGNLALSTSLAV
ncbi:MAG: hypothetical protein L6R39_006011 [Caloplaca ligustica]|nr:MAG: hypothetical protein L6R39_006011 [Caloplaca ligustica]